LPSLPALILVPPATTISTHHISGLFCHTTKPPAISPPPWTTPIPVLANFCPLVVLISTFPTAYMLAAALNAGSPPDAATYCSTMYFAFDTSWKNQNVSY
jgi:hypothetical protein